LEDLKDKLSISKLYTINYEIEKQERRISQVEEEILENANENKDLR
jgi:hypothetical protein